MPKSTTQRKVPVPAVIRKGRKPPPLNETARHRFIRIGQPRVINAVKAIRLLGNLARGDYEWDAIDVEKIKAILHRELDITMGEFTKNFKYKPDIHFEFREDNLADVLT